MIDAPGRWFFAVFLACAFCAISTPAHAYDDLLGPDKPLHFAATTLLAGGGYVVGASLDADPNLRFGLAFGVPIASGLAKELFDATRGGVFSRGDFAWDLLGTMTGVTLSWLIGEVLFPRAPRSERAEAAAVRVHFFLVK